MNICASCSGQTAAPILKDGVPHCIKCIRSGAISKPRPRVFIDLPKDGFFRGQATLRPLTFLGSDLFDSYRDIVSGCGFVYNRDHGVNHAHIKCVAPAISSLWDSGFQPVVAREISEMLTAEKERLRLSLIEAEERIDRFDDELYAIRNIRLMEFQRWGALWITARATLCGSGVLGDQMGLGKTIQVLASLPGTPPLVVCCPRVAKNTWKREISNSPLKYEIIFAEGRDGFAWPKAGQAVLVHNEILPPIYLDETDALLSQAQRAKAYASIRPILGSPQPGTWVIGDEAHLYKNKNAFRTVRFRAMCDWVRCLGGFAFEVTGTALHNSPPDLWTILENIDCSGEVFGHWGRMMRLLGGRKNELDGTLEWDPLLVHPQAGTAIKRAILRRERKDVLSQLPPKIYTVVDVPILGKMMKAGQSEDLPIFDSGTDDLKPADELWQKLRLEHGEELANLLTDPDAILKALRSEENFSTARWCLSNAKLEALEELLNEFEEQGEPVVVFSQFRVPIDMLELREGWAAIKGGQSDAIRERIELGFREGDYKGVACVIQSAGVSIRFERAAHAIFLDEMYSPADNVQAQDRLVAVTQKRGVTIWRMVSDHPLDLAVSRALDIKQKMFDATIGAATTTEHVAEKILAEFSSAASKAIPVDRNLVNAEFAKSAHRTFATNWEKWAIDALILLAGSSIYDDATEEDKKSHLFSDRDAEFGCSLAAQFRKKATLSPRQWPWVFKLASKIEYKGKLEELGHAARPETEMSISDSDESGLTGASAHIPDVPF